MKPHYPILDGLRGVAALLVVVFHILEVHFPHYPAHPVHHGYLAVDFFFLLSGFVIGYAYDDRWQRMSVGEFFKIRLIRLHPLIMLSMAFGAVGYWLDPNLSAAQHINGWKLLAITLFGLTLLPTPDLRSWGETHSLNGPLWSLLQEYIANLLYALVGRRLGQGALGLLVGVFALLLTWLAVRRGDVATGWSFDTFGHGLIRMLYPFFAGLLLFRTGKLIRVPAAFLLCSLLLAALFCLPYFGHNGLYEAATIIVAFPLIVAAGAGSSIGVFGTKVCKIVGDLSYPLYIIHYPLICLYTNWIILRKPLPKQALPVALGLFLTSLLLAYAALKWYDEPMRAWLRKRILLKQPGIGG
jgi:peptidoglycan/LPS O-acetylase OafA/YrhL